MQWRILRHVLLNSMYRCLMRYRRLYLQTIIINASVNSIVLCINRMLKRTAIAQKRKVLSCSNQLLSMCGRVSSIWQRISTLITDVNGSGRRSSTETVKGLFHSQYGNIFWFYFSKQVFCRFLSVPPFYINVSNTDFHEYLAPLPTAVVNNS